MKPQDPWEPRRKSTLRSRGGIPVTYPQYADHLAPFLRLS